MRYQHLSTIFVTAGAAAVAASMAAWNAADAAPPAPPWFEWTTVVNNNDLMPTDDERCERIPTPRRCFFNSYNQPSVNLDGLVVIRARSRGGGGGGGGGEGGGGQNQPIHGIYTRDMGVTGSPIVRILDRTTEVPQPNEKDESCEQSEPRLILVVGRARRVGTVPVRGDIFCRSLLRGWVAGEAAGDGALDGRIGSGRRQFRHECCDKMLFSNRMRPSGTVVPIGR